MSEIERDYVSTEILPVYAEWLNRANERYHVANPDDLTPSTKITVESMVKDASIIGLVDWDRFASNYRHMIVQIDNHDEGGPAILFATMRMSYPSEQYVLEYLVHEFDTIFEPIYQIDWRTREPQFVFEGRPEMIVTKEE